ncbi:MAG: NRDE family protein [Pseudomonadota bacterium]|nr:NRDE family protein [Pseudomonadota bacterium]
MCFILIGINANTRYPFVIAANRDEYHARATAPAQFWSDYPDLYAGKDEEAGGTWMGLTRYGRFAALTNFSEPQSHSGPRSRGQLVLEYLLGSGDADQYLTVQRPNFGQYGGFNLLVGECRTSLHWASNRHSNKRKLSSGVFALSNHLLDTPGSKISNGKMQFSKVLSSSFSQESLFDLLRDETPAEELSTQVSHASRIARLRSSVFVRSAEYGTRSSTVITIGRDDVVRYSERSFDSVGVQQATAAIEFKLL